MRIPPSASVYHDTSWIGDVLELEQVKLIGGDPSVGVSGWRLRIRIDDDKLVDQMVKALQSVQRERQINALRSQAKQFYKDYQAAEVLQGKKRVELREVTERLNHFIAKYQEARHALAALGDNAMTDADHRATDGED